MTCVRRQVEDSDAEERDEDARNDEVDGVEERLAADADVVRDGGDIVKAVGVPHLADLARTADYVPRPARHVVAQIRLTATTPHSTHIPHSTPAERTLYAEAGSRRRQIYIHLYFTTNGRQ